MTDVCLSRSYVGVCGCMERDGGVYAFGLAVWGEFSRRYSTLGGVENPVAFCECFFVGGWKGSVKFLFLLRYVYCCF